MKQQNTVSSDQVEQGKKCEKSIGSENCTTRKLVEKEEMQRE